jgi:hypothetical protein
MSTTDQAEHTDADRAVQPVARLFRYSTWVHVGPDAEQCDEGQGGGCANPLHFHAWCRLPNQFQHREIRLKALAAKASYARRLRDQGTDAYEVLESELDELLRAGDVVRDAIVDELMSKAWWKEYLEAMKDVRADDTLGGDDVKGALFEHIEHDQQRLQALSLMAEDDRPADEFSELQSHVVAYHTAVAARHLERTTPEREALTAQPLADLIDLLRTDRIAAAADDEFAHVYNSWQWVAGTLTQPGPRGTRVIASVEALQELAPEVVEALQEVFDDLERTSTEVSGEGNG